MSASVLFKHYPELAVRLPVIPIVQSPTPVERLLGLERRLDTGPLWIKRDDLTANPYGGNKPRKLEFLLGTALRRHATTLITFGGLGSNHVFATAIYGLLHGFSTKAILIPQPIDDYVRRRLADLDKLNVDITRAPNPRAATVAAARSWIAAVAADRHRPYLIMPGGSSPLGSLGYVAGALELADQIAAGELPVPAAVVVASGSNGTAAGLLAGFALAGLKTKLVVVQVSDRRVINPRVIAILANTSLALLRRLSPVLIDHPIAPEIQVLSHHLGAGYGYSTEAAEQAINLLGDAEEIALDTSYTGKAVAALLEICQLPEWRDRPLLYWHTYDARPVDVGSIAGAMWPTRATQRQRGFDIASELDETTWRFGMPPQLGWIAGRQTE